MIPSGPERRRTPHWHGSVPQSWLWADPELGAYGYCLGKSYARQDKDKNNKSCAGDNNAVRVRLQKVIPRPVYSLTSVGNRRSNRKVRQHGKRPESWMLYVCLEKMPADSTVAARFYAGFRHVQLRAVEKNLTDILRSIKMNFDAPLRDRP